MSRFAASTCLAALLTLAALGSGSSALAGWGPEGVTVWPTTSVISVVAACNDGGHGTFVAWQEGSIYTSPGLLRVQHLLPNGDLDPAWPASGSPASDVAAFRTFVTTVPDREGGVYVCWTEGTNAMTIFLTRLDEGGQVASGWPASGKSIGHTGPTLGRPSVIEDGAHGLFVAWPAGTTVRAQRFGTDGLGTGGWPDAPLAVVPEDTVITIHHWPDLALAPDGGVFLSWGTWSFDTTAVPSGLYVRRLTGAGAHSAGWPVGKLKVGSLRPEGLNYQFPSVPLLDISPDGRGGLFVYAGSLWSRSGYAGVDRRLHRLMSDGQTSPDWPEAGHQRLDPFYYEWSAGPDHGLRVHPDGRDGAFVEEQAYVLHTLPSVSFARCTAAGQWTPDWRSAILIGTGHEVVVTGDGRAFLAEVVPAGPYGPYQPYARIGVYQWDAPPGWTSWYQSHPGYSYAYQFYGDIALAPSGDGGAVFFWSQVRERFGLFARRFAPGGQVFVRQPGWEITPLLQLRFAAGAGVLARIGLDRTPERLDLFDVCGRRVASLPLWEGSSTDELTLPGTASLAPGLYFARLMAGGVAAVGKVAVVH